LIRIRAEAFPVFSALPAKIAVSQRFKAYFGRIPEPIIGIDLRIVKSIYRTVLVYGKAEESVFIYILKSDRIVGGGNQRFVLDKCVYL